MIKKRRSGWVCIPMRSRYNLVIVAVKAGHRHGEFFRHWLPNMLDVMIYRSIASTLSFPSSHIDVSP
jgi:hypothetical protein